MVLEGADQVGCLVGLHLLDEPGGLGGRELLDDVCGRFGSHLVEHVCCGQCCVEVGEQVGGALLVERLEDVGRVVGVLLGDLFPLVLVGIEVQLGVLRVAGGQIPKVVGCDPAATEPKLHARSLSPLKQP